MNDTLLNEFARSFVIGLRSDDNWSNDFSDEEMAAWHPFQNVFEWFSIYHLLTQACLSKIPGDVVEIGCNAGATSAMMQMALDYNSSASKLYLYDGFQGMPAISPKDHEVGAMPPVIARPSAIEFRFKQQSLKRPTIVPGWIEETIPKHLPETIAFALLDTDLYGPIKHSLEYVYPRMSPGGIIVIDDYQNQDFPGARIATDEFFSDKPERIQPMVFCGNVYVRKQ